MEELSLHILDIAENSIAALAALVIIRIAEDTAQDLLTIEVEDDGCGMEEEVAQAVTNPFVTSRTTRKVGLGIPMFKASAEAADGSFTLESAKGKGTRIQATFTLSHLDRPPLGSIVDTMVTLCVCNPDRPDFVLRYRVDENEYTFDTREIKEILGEEVPLSLPEVAAWMKNDLHEGIIQLNGGA